MVWTVRKVEFVRIVKFVRTILVIGLDPGIYFSGLSVFGINFEFI